AALPRRSASGGGSAGAPQRRLGDALSDDRDPDGRVLGQPPRRGGAERARPAGTRLMWPYIVRRLLSGLVMLFAVTLMTFAVFRLIPFTPACIIVPLRAPHDDDRRADPGRRAPARDRPARSRPVREVHLGDRPARELRPLVD